MKKLPLGIQTLSKIIENDYLYVDKTEQIYKLLSDGGVYYFLSRPRRFGKSLLISTLKEIFSGNRELFRDLWIYDKIEWDSFPVIHLDFSKMSLENPDTFRKSIEFQLQKIAEEKKINFKNAFDYRSMLEELIDQLRLINQVVILVDEYDKPIIEFVEQPEVADKMRDILKNIFTTVKACEKDLRFAFLTGVSKFSKVSVFSGLNNLIDITFADKFATLLGYTEIELNKYFSEQLRDFSAELKISGEVLAREIKNWYNGYSWDGKSFVYNPFSILSLFYQKKFGNYWFSSGTPTFLLKMIREYNIDIKSLDNYEAEESLFDAFDINQMNVESLLFQTGYLTIKKIISKSITRKKYILNYPNLEVKESLLRNIFEDFINKGNSGILINNLAESLEENSLDNFFIRLKSLIASIPSHIFIKDKESYYHTLIYLILTLVGVRIKAEVHTNKGRIDAVIETEQTVYILEFKLGAAEKSLEQIEKMNYHQPYLAQGKKIVFVGIGFAIEERNIGDYLVKELSVN